MKTNDKIWLQTIIKKMLNEQQDYDPGSAAIYSTLIAPFVDVFKVANVAFKDTVSLTIDSVRYLLSIDNEKRREIKRRYRERRQAYAGQMQEALRSTKESFSTPDAKLFMWMVAPGMMSAKLLSSAAWNTSEPVRDVAFEKFEDLLGTIDKYDARADFLAKQKQANTGPVGGLLNDLRSLFFLGESFKRGLSEQENKKQNKAPDQKEIYKLAQEYLESSGMKDVLETGWYAILDDKQKEIDAVLKDRQEIIQRLKELATSETFEQAKTTISKFSDSKNDLLKSLEKAEQIYKQQIEELSKGDEKSKKLIDDLRKTPDGSKLSKNATEEDFKKIIEKGILTATFSDSVEQARQSGIKDIVIFVAEMDEKELADLSKTGDLGKEYYEMIKKFSQDLNQI
jgi:hypothetical protein